jgi:hypothetical protein
MHNVQLTSRELTIIREFLSYLDLDVLNDNLSRARQLEGKVTDEELEELDSKLHRASKA